MKIEMSKNKKTSKIYTNFGGFLDIKNPNKSFTKE